MSRYIPPALRKNLSSKEGHDAAGGFLPRKLNDLTLASTTQHLSLHDIANHYGRLDSMSTSATLNDSSRHPRTLRYVVLHHDANPRWNDDKIIFCKTNIDLLPGFKECTASETVTLQAQAEVRSPLIPDNTIDATLEASTGVVESDARPVAVFTQNRRGRAPDRCFDFTGYFKIARVDFLPPHSDGLKRMLEQKWDLKDRRGKQRDVLRSPQEWKKSFDHTWAVVQMSEIHGDECPAAPVIAHVDYKVDSVHPFNSENKDAVIIAE